MGIESVQPKRKRSFIVSLFIFLTVGGVLLLALIIAACVWDSHRSDYAWKQFEDRVNAAGLYLGKDLLFPSLPADNQNFAGISSMRVLVNTNEFLSVQEVVSSLSDEHCVHQPEGLPDRFWYTGYSWTAEDVRQVLHSCGAAMSPEPEVTPQGNLQFFEIFEPQFQELKAGLERPFCQFWTPFEMGPQINTLHLNELYKMSLLLSARAATQLSMGRSQAAMEDQIFCWNLIHRMSSDRTITAALDCESCFLYSLQPLWQGITQHFWDKDQLTQLQTEVSRFDFIRSFKRNMLFETLWIVSLKDSFESVWVGDAVGFTIEKLHLSDKMLDLLLNNELFPKLIENIPTGWLRMNLINLAESIFSYCDEVYRVDEHRIVPKKTIGLIRDFESQYENSLNPDRLIAARFKDALFSETIPQNSARGQAFVDMAGIACMLELSYLDQKKYPETLEELVLPEGVKLPTDVITGGNYIFSISSASFQLYSIGWDDRDNYGRMIESSSGMRDWVWPPSDHHPTL